MPISQNRLKHIIHHILHSVCFLSPLLVMLLAKYYKPDFIGDDTRSQDAFFLGAFLFPLWETPIFLNLGGNLKFFPLMLYIGKPYEISRKFCARTWGELMIYYCNCMPVCRLDYPLLHETPPSPFSVQFSCSVCLTLCNPTDFSISLLPFSYLYCNFLVSWLLKKKKLISYLVTKFHGWS